MISKISHDKADAVYSILVKTLGVSNDYHERETFIYHHSMVNHDIIEYTLTSDNDKLFKFSISEPYEKVKSLYNSDDNSTFDIEDNTIVNTMLKKANKLIDWKLKQHDTTSTWF